MTKRIIIHYDEDGIMSVYAEEGLDVEILSICEPAPGDRVYQMRPAFMTTEEITALIGESPIGLFDDERAAALTARIEEAMTGKPRLSVVRSEPEMTP